MVKTLSKEASRIHWRGVVEHFRWKGSTFVYPGQRGGIFIFWLDRGQKLIFSLIGGFLAFLVKHLDPLIF